MYKIGDFSKITNLSVKTLHYYDEQGILTPSLRADNGYRYYDEGDFTTARLIVFLRDMDFGIAEIKEVLASYDNKDDLAYFLSDKKKIIEERVSRDQKLIKKIDAFIEPGKMADMSEYNVKIKDLSPVRVASIRFKGAYQDTGRYLGIIFGKLKGQVQGSSFNCYHDGGFTEVADIEVCVPTNQYIDGDGIVIKELPGVKALCTVNHGSYDYLNYAYKALLDYAGKMDIECGLPTREIYHKGPGMLFMGNPNKYMTEIAVPIIQGEFNGQ